MQCKLQVWQVSVQDTTDVSLDLELVLCPELRPWQDAVLDGSSGCDRKQLTDRFPLRPKYDYCKPMHFVHAFVEVCAL